MMSDGRHHRRDGEAGIASRAARGPVRRASTRGGDSSSDAPGFANSAAVTPTARASLFRRFCSTASLDPAMRWKHRAVSHALGHQGEPRSRDRATVSRLVPGQTPAQAWQGRPRRVTRLPGRLAGGLQGQQETRVASSGPLHTPRGARPPAAMPAGVIPTSVLPYGRALQAGHGRRPASARARPLAGRAGGGYLQRSGRLEGESQREVVSRPCGRGPGGGPP